MCSSGKMAFALLVIVMVVSWKISVQADERKVKWRFTVEISNQEDMLAF